MQNIYHLLYNFLKSLGIAEQSAASVNVIIFGLLVLSVLWVVDYFISKVLVKLISRFAEKSETKFDDFLVQNRAPRIIAHIIPLGLAFYAAPFVFADFPDGAAIAHKVLMVYGVVLTLWIVRSLLKTFNDYFKTLPSLADKPIDSYIQVFMIFAWLAGFMLSIAVITGIPIWKFFTVLGATSAIIVLVFKDTILGFVASIQVSINDMVRIGDWITFEKYGADGDVIEINLATVKVQNFDNTITTIPTYALISDSFKNWRGMTNSGGRRIKRAIFIKQEGVKYLSKEAMEKLKKVNLIKAYIETKEKDISHYNEENEVDKSILINGRSLTNLGVFRKYIDSYVQHHSAINKEMMIMVRHLAPTNQGIPIEIYAFSSDKRWGNYEYIMADIFDHIIAAVPYFELEIFELPSSTSPEKFTGVS
jgi:miniconductance mechanosensitive channel